MAIVDPSTLIWCGNKTASKQQIGIGAEVAPITRW